MSTITITYTAPTAPAVKAASICAVMDPTNAACDNAVFAGTYYDTNVAGNGDALALEQFMAKMVAHPGLVAGLRAAMRDGEYEIEDASAEDVLYMNEIKNSGALVDQGFTITIA